MWECGMTDGLTLEWMYNKEENNITPIYIFRSKRDLEETVMKSSKIRYRFRNSR